MIAIASNQTNQCPLAQCDCGHEVCLRIQRHLSVCYSCSREMRRDSTCSHSGHHRHIGRTPSHSSSAVRCAVSCTVSDSSFHCDSCPSLLSRRPIFHRKAPFHYATMLSLSFVLAALLLAVHPLSALSIRPCDDSALYHAYQHTNRSSFTASANTVSATAAVNAVVGTLRFTPVTREAAWSARSIGAVELFTRPLSFRTVDGKTVSIPANAFVLHGGSGAFNDVWVSSDHGRNWWLAAGVTIDSEAAVAPADDTSFTNYHAPAVLIDYNSNVYRIGGRERSGDQDLYYGDVWTTTNGLQWSNTAETSTAPFDSDRFYAGAIATSKGELILQGGTVNNFQEYKSDVWSSTNGGRSWRLQTAMTEFGTRGIGVLLHSQHSDRLGAKDILYSIGGQNEKDNNNEGTPTTLTTPLLSHPLAHLTGHDPAASTSSPHTQC